MTHVYLSPLFWNCRWSFVAGLASDNLSRYHVDCVTIGSDVFAARHVAMLASAVYTTALCPSFCVLLSNGRDIAIFHMSEFYRNG